MATDFRVLDDSTSHHREAGGTTGSSSAHGAPMGGQGGGGTRAEAWRTSLGALLSETESNLARSRSLDEVGIGGGAAGGDGGHGSGDGRPPRDSSSASGDPWALGGGTPSGVGAVGLDDLAAEWGFDDEVVAAAAAHDSGYGLPSRTGSGSSVEAGAESVLARGDFFRDTLTQMSDAVRAESSARLASAERSAAVMRAELSRQAGVIERLTLHCQELGRVVRQQQHEVRACAEGMGAVRERVLQLGGEMAVLQRNHASVASYLSEVHGATSRIEARVKGIEGDVSACIPRSEAVGLITAAIDPFQTRVQMTLDQHGSSLASNASSSTQASRMAQDALQQLDELRGSLSALSSAQDELVTQLEEAELRHKAEHQEIVLQAQTRPGQSPDSGGSSPRTPVSRSRSRSPDARRTQRSRRKGGSDERDSSPSVEHVGAAESGTSTAIVSQSPPGVSEAQLKRAIEEATAAAVAEARRAATEAAVAAAREAAMSEAVRQNESFAMRLEAVRSQSREDAARREVEHSRRTADEGRALDAKFREQEKTIATLEHRLELALSNYETAVSDAAAAKARTAALERKLTVMEADVARSIRERSEGKDEAKALAVELRAAAKASREAADVAEARIAEAARSHSAALQQQQTQAQLQAQFQAHALQQAQMQLTQALNRASMSAATPAGPAAVVPPPAPPTAASATTLVAAAASSGTGLVAGVATAPPTPAPAAETAAVSGSTEARTNVSDAPTASQGAAAPAQAETAVPSMATTEASFEATAETKATVQALSAPAPETSAGGGGFGASASASAASAATVSTPKTREEAVRRAEESKRINEAGANDEAAGAKARLEARKREREKTQALARTATSADITGPTSPGRVRKTGRTAVDHGAETPGEARVLSETRSAYSMEAAKRRQMLSAAVDADAGDSDSDEGSEQLARSLASSRASVSPSPPPGPRPKATPAPLPKQRARADAPVVTKQCVHCLKRQAVTDLAKHMEECECRPLKCRHCGVTRIAVQMPTHEKTCQARPTSPQPPRAFPPSRVAGTQANAKSAGGTAGSKGADASDGASSRRSSGSKGPDQAFDVDALIAEGVDRAGRSHADGSSSSDEFEDDDEFDDGGSDASGSPATASEDTEEPKTPEKKPEAPEKPEKAQTKAAEKKVVMSPAAATAAYLRSLQQKAEEEAATKATEAAAPPSPRPVMNVSPPPIAPTASVGAPPGAGAAAVASRAVDPPRATQPPNSLAAGPPKRPPPVSPSVRSPPMRYAAASRAVPTSTLSPTNVSTSPAEATALSPQSAGRGGAPAAETRTADRAAHDSASQVAAAAADTLRSVASSEGDAGPGSASAEQDARSREEAAELDGLSGGSGVVLGDDDGQSPVMEGDSDNDGLSLSATMRPGISLGGTMDEHLRGPHAGVSPTSPAGHGPLGSFEDDGFPLTEADVLEWTVQDVCDWLEQDMDMPHYMQQFVAMEIDGATLLNLAEHDLAEELHVDDPDDLRRLWAVLCEIRGEEPFYSDEEPAEGSLDGSHALEASAGALSTGSGKQLPSLAATVRSPAALGRAAPLGGLGPLAPSGAGDPFRKALPWQKSPP